MKKILLVAAAAALFSLNAQAQDTNTETSIADTWVRSDREINNGSTNAVELQTINNNNTKWFYGLLGFSLPGSNYTITSAQLRLTTERVKR